jgi:hypothetical protein
MPMNIGILIFDRNEEKTHSKEKKEIKFLSI